MQINREDILNKIISNIDIVPIISFIMYKYLIVKDIDFSLGIPFIFLIVCVVNTLLKNKKILTIVVISIYLIGSAYEYKLLYPHFLSFIPLFILVIYFYRLLIFLNVKRDKYYYLLCYIVIVHIQKMLLYKSYDLKVQDIVFPGFLIFALYYFQNIGRKILINIKKISLENIINFLIVIYPFFLIKRGNSLDILYAIVIIKIIDCIKKRNLNLNKNEKILVLFAIASIVIFIISTIGKDISEYTVMHLKSYVLNVILFIVVLQGNINKKMLIKMYKSFWIISFIPICIIYPILLNSDFMFGRISGYWNISTYSFLVLVLATFSLYMSLAKKNYEFLFTTLLLYILILFSGTRMIWLVTLISTGIIPILLKSKKIFFITLLLMILGTSYYKSLDNDNPIKMRSQAFFRIKEDTSSGIRVYMYKESVEQFLEKPILGHGFCTYGKIASERHKNDKILQNELEGSKKYYAYFYYYHAHSNFFDLLSGTGILGILGFYLFNIYILLIFIKSRNCYKYLANIGILLWIAFHFYSISDVTLYMSRVTESYLFLSAVLLGYILKNKNLMECKIKNKENNDTFKAF